MTFASNHFFIFFIWVWCAYWFAPKFLPRSLLLLVASWYFYAASHWPFLGILLTFTTVDYWVARGIGHARELAEAEAEDKKNKSHKRGFYLLLLSLGCNLGVLAFFKLSLVFKLPLGRTDPTAVGYLPVGISFYTFQSISYLVDVYRGKIRAHKNFVEYALYIAFFPQLVAGPIERAKTLLVQFAEPWWQRRPSEQLCAEAAWLIFWGLVKKIAIADRLAPFTRWSISDLHAQGAGEVWLGSVVFILQFLCDFSAYTDMARGLALLFGVRLTENFRSPYFATSPREFWQRWHISLGSWFRDYVYGPLVRRGLPRWLALVGTMTLVGLWHGAEPKFIVWGFFWGVILAADALCAARLKTPVTALAQQARALLGWALVMLLWILSGFLFVAHDVQGALTLLARTTQLTLSTRVWADALTACGYLLPFILIEALERRSRKRYFWFSWPPLARFLFILALTLFFLGSYAPQGRDFIYFAF